MFDPNFLVLNSYLEHKTSLYGSRSVMIHIHLRLLPGEQLLLEVTSKVSQIQLNGCSLLLSNKSIYCFIEFLLILYHIETKKNKHLANLKVNTIKSLRNRDSCPYTIQNKPWRVAETHCSLEKKKKAMLLYIKKKTLSCGKVKLMERDQT